jgi:hypothetical protein
MGPIGDAVLIEKHLRPGNIGFENIQINNCSRGV